MILGSDVFDRMMKAQYGQALRAQINNDTKFFVMLAADNAAYADSQRTRRFADGIPTQWKSTGYVPPLSYPDWMDE